MDPLGVETSDALGVETQVSLETGVDVDGAADPTKERLRFFSAGAVVEATLDAAIAAYPVTVSPATGAFAVTKGVPFTLYERILLVGEVLALDVHFLGYIGDVGGADPEYQDVYFLAWRESSGDVQVMLPGGIEAGRIPGFEIKAEGTVDRVRVLAKMRKSATLNVLVNTVKIKEQGVIT